MSELTDLEIGQKIAEINNDDVTLILKSDTEYETWLYCNESGGEYNPLTDDALCFQLMIKYRLQLTRLNNENYICNKQNVYVNINNLTKGVRLPNRAICLAIIAIHK